MLFVLLMVLFSSCKDKRSLEQAIKYRDQAQRQLDRIEVQNKQQAEAKRQEEKAKAKKHMEQAQRQLDRIEVQNKRYNSLLDKWEEQAKRQDAILDAKERQLKLK